GGLERRSCFFKFFLLLQTQPEIILGGRMLRIDLCHCRVVARSLGPILLLETQMSRARVRLSRIFALRRTLFKLRDGFIKASLRSKRNCSGKGVGVFRLGLYGTLCD